jgi:hypothetical protein
MEPTTKHDDRYRRVIYADVCHNAHEQLDRFASLHGVSKVGFLDALIHALPDADPSWLENVVAQARTIDTSRRDRRGR